MAELRRVKVRARYLSKQYELTSKRSDKVKALFFKVDFPKFWAVRGVDFEAYEGETIAVLGTNGSGKSTLMKMIAGIVPPTTGTVEVSGETSLLAINAGLRGNMTGRENIRLKALMMGLTNKEINAKMADIIEFSELGNFIDQQVKSYSSGMKSKLGFAISVHMNPDILIIDEALSVGDATFNRKSLAKIKEFQAQGKTIFFVSHSLSQVREMADRIIWMHYGHMRAFGPADKVLRQYQNFVRRYKSFSKAHQASYRAEYKGYQTAFNLDRLYRIELNRAEQSKGRLLTRKERAEIYSATQEVRQTRKLNWLGKIGLVGLTLLTLILGVKITLNMTVASVIEHPTHLITNFAPDKLAALNRNHGRGIQTAPPEPAKKRVTEKVSNKKPSAAQSKTDSSATSSSTVVAVNTYTVQEGDTLEVIAAQFGISVDALMSTNGLVDNNLQVGQELQIPSEGGN